jgi:beta-glucosidase
MFCARPGAIWSGHNGDVACDHFHRCKEDVALMKQLGVKACRLSVAWPRVLSDGAGRANSSGMDFYNRLVDELLSAGIEPWITLFHWDFPHELYCRGGWLNCESADWFADYAAVVGKALGDRVTQWMTINEPECVAVLGHQAGIQAPGDKLAPNEVVYVMRHLLLAHGRGAQALRASTAEAPKVCIPTTLPIVPT